ncbi:Rho termination factor N-terminal domain-containing protein [Georgenia sp. SUBG003]|uniref:Rho termination factor N-terminal domain-containing protein n=1 Tax=Georgenia sp. SUBG003 TaxID=1497974 RepID=UPI003AB7FF90
MTETVDAPTTGTAAPRRGSLTTLRLPELQALAGEMGLKGTAKMRKSDLVAAIREARGDGNGTGRTAAPKQSQSAAPSRAAEPAGAVGPGGRGERQQHGGGPGHLDHAAAREGAAGKERGEDLRDGQAPVGAGTERVGRRDGAGGRAVVRSAWPGRRDAAECGTGHRRRVRDAAGIARDGPGWCSARVRPGGCAARLPSPRGSARRGPRPGGRADHGWRHGFRWWAQP